MQYLLLDDLFEWLEEPDDWERRRALAELIGYILRHWEPAEEAAAGPEDDAAGLAVENERLHTALVELYESIAIRPHLHSVAAETRDAILVWINRVQKHQRACLRSRHAALRKHQAPSTETGRWTTDAAWWG